MRDVQHAADFGVIIKGEIGFDWAKVIARSRGVADKMAKGVEFLFKKNKVTHIPGTAIAHRARASWRSTTAGRQATAS